MFDTEQNVAMAINSVNWKEKHPSFTMGVEKVTIRESEDGYFQKEGFVCIILEGNGKKFESLITKNLSGLIVAPKKYKIWYDFYRYPLGVLTRMIEILCVEEI